MYVELHVVNTTTIWSQSDFLFLKRVNVDFSLVFVIIAQLADFQSFVRKTQLCDIYNPATGNSHL